MKNVIKIFLLFLFTLFPVSCSIQMADVNGEDALDYIQTQVNFGFRIPGTQASKDTADFIYNHLKSEGWMVSYQEFSKNNIPMQNIIAKNSRFDPQILLGTHFDTRRYSDQESEDFRQATPVVGANDGASGTALLLELSRCLVKLELPIGLVFFDGEDQGKIDGREWSVGSKYFVEHLDYRPDKVVIIDMIADEELNIYREINSTKFLCDEIWLVAENKGYQPHFIDEEKYSLIDDHVPFLEKGIPACLVIDFDYAYWHTNQDTLEHVSPGSLEIVGDVILTWICEYGN